MKKEKEDELRKIWEEYKKTNSQNLREKLILHYSPLVKYVAGRISSALPPNVEVADLVSYGIFGLIDAIEKFEPERGIKFETYAISRIKGAIVDELRALDWVPRSVRHMGRELERVYQELESKLKRVPTEEELAEALNISLEKFNELLTQLSYTSIVALEELKTSGRSSEDKVALIDIIEDRSGEDPLQTYENKEIQQALGEAIEELSEREKIIITLYYYEGLTLKEIGKILGITESRVSQLRTKSIYYLKTALKRAKLIT